MNCLSFRYHLPTLFVFFFGKTVRNTKPQSINSKHVGKININSYVYNPKSHEFIKYTKKQAQMVNFRLTLRYRFLV